MGVKKPLTVGSRFFEKQGDAKDFFSGILWKYKVGDHLDSSDAVDVGHLLERHRDYAKKIGPGIIGFLIMISDEGSRCFGVERVDGAKVGFSYQRCIDQRWE